MNGAKYDETLDVADIAKLIRKDIKAAVKAGVLPDEKYAVKIARFSMGRSIDVHVKTWPTAYRRMINIVDYGDVSALTDEAMTTLLALQDIVRAYQRDGDTKHPSFFDHQSFNLEALQPRDTRCFGSSGRTTYTSTMPPRRQIVCVECGAVVVDPSNPNNVGNLPTHVKAGA